MADELKYVRYTPVRDAQQSRTASNLSAVPNEQKCASCAHVNSESAKFCADCGMALRSPSVCPNCSSPVLPEGDICEVCSSWLLQTQCKFCSAPIAETQAYCGSCGIPSTGISCPRCGELSIFDFCKTCATPLTNEARSLSLAATNDPAHQEIAALFEDLLVLQPTPERSDLVSITRDVAEVVYDEQLDKMKLARRSLSAPTLPRDNKARSRSLLSDQQKKQISLLGDQIVQEEERLRLEKERLRQEAEQKLLEQEERRRKVQEQINQALSRLADKTFATSQDARRYFMSLLSALPAEAMQALNTSGRFRWRCHAYSCEHDSPAQCAAPSRGGVWLIR